MSDAVLFSLVFGGLFIARVIAATLIFGWLLPKGDRCPNCDSVTLRLEGRWRHRLLPWFRKSWCIGCGWEGMLRKGELTPQEVAERERREVG